MEITVDTAKSTPSQTAKSAGLKNLAQVIEITGVARSTLVDWYHNKPKLFNAVILGCKTISEDENERLHNVD